MAFELSDYQLAALQEMNITVWRKAENTSSELPASEKTPAGSMPSNRDAQSRLQQLKAQIKQPEVRQLAPAAPHASEPAKPVRMKLDEIRYKSFVDDIKLALNGLDCQFEPLVYISEFLTVDKHAILIPTTPEKLSVADKKALWHALRELV